MKRQFRSRRVRRHVLSVGMAGLFMAGAAASEHRHEPEKFDGDCRQHPVLPDEGEYAYWQLVVVLSGTNILDALIGPDGATPLVLGKIEKATSMFSTELLTDQGEQGFRVYARDKHGVYCKAYVRAADVLSVHELDALLVPG